MRQQRLDSQYQPVASCSLFNGFANISKQRCPAAKQRDNAQRSDDILNSNAFFVVMFVATVAPSARLAPLGV